MTRSARIAVVDYCKGNLKSVERGLRFVGADAFITDDPDAIRAADAIALPGVGAFRDAADSMAGCGQLAAIRSAIAAGTPFLGICLGMHLMFEEGTEGSPDEDDETSTHNALGLAVLPGVVGHMPRTSADGRTFKIPHVGWNTVEPAAPDAGFGTPIMDGIDAGEFFYFTHSYIAPENPCTRAITTHSMSFPSVVDYRGTAFGVQFHPEKSSDAGMQVLRNFIAVVNTASAR